MKTPLRYQASEFDCGPTAVLNAISFLYDTEEIPPDFIKKIYEVSLDNYLGGRAFYSGTSMISMCYLSGWMDSYARHSNFPLHTEFYQGSGVSLCDDSPILKCLRNGGAAVVRCILETDHYITLTGIDGDHIHVFDPYYEDDPPAGPGVTLINDRPKEMNRKIDISVMNCNASCDYAFCSLKHRCAMLIYRTVQEKFKLD